MTVFQARDLKQKHLFNLAMASRKAGRFQVSSESIHKIRLISHQSSNILRSISHEESQFVHSASMDLDFWRLEEAKVLKRKEKKEMNEIFSSFFFFFYFFLVILGTKGI